VVPLKDLFCAFSEKGAICIADEVQVGFGRTGKMWGFEWEDVVPDIVTLGKPIANGFPMGAVIIRSEIAEAFEDSNIEYFNTYGGNPVATRVASVVLKSIKEDKLIENAKTIGEYLKNVFEGMSDIKEVRGRGLFIGLVFNEDVISAEKMCNELKDKHCILAGHSNGVLRIKGPLIMKRSEANMLIDGIKNVLMAFSHSV
jgi:4-aminobutyrate aminotransferase-like enzyme